MCLDQWLDVWSNACLTLSNHCQGFIPNFDHMDEFRLQLQVAKKDILDFKKKGDHAKNKEVGFWKA